MSLLAIIESAREDAYHLGAYSIMRVNYTTLLGENRDRLWIEKDDGEGMETTLESIPEGITPEWMDAFWKENF